MKKIREHILFFAAMLLSVAAFAQYPGGVNKQRLGFQTTGDGLVYRGRLSDTTAIKPANINNAFYLQDTINDKLYRYIKTNGGWKAVQGRVQKLGVGADGPSSAVLYLSDTDTEESSAVVIVDGLTSLQLPGVNNTVVGIVTVTTIQHGVTVTGTGLAVVTETAQGEDGQITISVIIPSGYVTPDMLQAGTVDTLTTLSVTDATSVDTAYVIVNTINALELPWDGNSVVGYVASGGGIKNAVYLNVNGRNILIQGGGAMDMSANDAGDILTITSATNVVVQQVTGVGKAYSVVDAISTLRLPWDGDAILAVTEEFVSNDVTLTINDTTVTFKVGVTDGDKFDITVAGDTWTIKDNAVQWNNLDQATRDSIAGAGFSMPVDSITFNNNESDPDSLELQYNYDKGSLVYGANGGIEIPILPGHWYVRNDTSVTITKGTVVRASGTLGASGRIKVKHMIADGSVDAMYLLGIAAHDIAPGADGYVMTQGKIRKINTNAYTEGAVLYADDFIPGGLTEFEPTGSKLKLPIAFVVHKATNGTLAVRIDPGSYLRDLHDVGITNPVAGDVLKLLGNGIWAAGKDSTIYKFDGTLTGNRTMFMNGFQLLFKDTSDIYDYVNIRENYVNVSNTLNDYSQTMTQYGFTNAGFVSPEKTEIRMDIGEIRMYATDTKNTSPSPGPDLRIDGDGSITFRVSAGGTVDSLYGKNAQGELTAIDRDVFYGTGSTVPVASGGTGLTDFGGAGRVPYSTGAGGTGLQFDTLFRVSPTNGNFVFGAPYMNNTDNVIIGRVQGAIFGNSSGTGNIAIGPNTMYGFENGATYNVNIGYYAGYLTSTGDRNVNLGVNAGSAITTGANNINIGVLTGSGNSTGSGNIIIGNEINSPVSNGSNRLAIGNIIFGQNMDSIGTAIPVNGRVGIKVASPTRDLHVAGEMRVTDLDAGVNPGQLVGADSNGVFQGVTLGTGLTMSGDTLNADAAADYVGIVIYAPDDTVVNSTYSKDFFIVPQGLNGYCIDGVTSKALAGTGTADIQVRIATTDYFLSSISGTTAASANTNISLSTGNVIRGNIENLSGTLIGLGITLEIRKTCN